MKLAPLYDCTNTDEEEYDPALNTGYNPFTSSLCTFNSTTNTDDPDNEDNPDDNHNEPRYTAPLHCNRNNNGLVENDTAATHTDAAFATLVELNHTDAGALIVVAFDTIDAHTPRASFHKPPRDVTFVNKPPHP